MNCIKTLHELLTKSLFIVLLFMVGQVGYGQTHFGPIQLPSVEADIEQVNVVHIGESDEQGSYYEVDYEADLHMDIDLGYINPVTVNEISFNIELGGFQSWTLDQSDFEIAGEEVQVTVTPDFFNTNLYSVNAVFNSGINSNLVAFELPRIATVGVLIEDRDEFSRTADCFDFHVEQTASVEISSVIVNIDKLNGSTYNIAVEGDFYEEDFELPSCVGKGFDVGQGNFNVNLMVKEITETAVNVDVYMICGNSISSGELIFMYSGMELENPSFTMSPTINGSLDNSGLAVSVLTFSNASLPQSAGNALYQTYLGTLTFDYAFPNPGSTTASIFNVSSLSSVIDTNGDELNGVTFGNNPNYIDDEFFSIKHLSLKVANSQSIELIKISPNPAKDNLKIFNLKNAEEALIRIYTIEGQMAQELYVKDNGSKEFEVNVSDLSAGTFILNIVSSERVYNDKFIVQK